MPRGLSRGLILAMLACLPACRFLKSESSGQPVELPRFEVNTQFAELPRRLNAASPDTVVTEPAIEIHRYPPMGTRDEPVVLPKVSIPLTPIGPVVPEANSPTEPPLLAAVRAYLEDRPDQAILHLQTLDKANQELLLQLIPAIVRASQVPLSQANPHEIGLLIRELQGPMHSLSQRGPLFIDQAVFVRSVKGFGRYDALPERFSFKPGSTAGLYIEVGNVPSVPSDSEGFVTHLSCSLEVRDSSGHAVDWSDRKSRKPVEQLRETQREVTKSPVRDYFVVSWFPVPSKPGVYTVSFEVRDQATGRAVSKTLPLRVN